MASVGSVVVCLSELKPGMEAVCYAILSKRETKESKNGSFYICHFKNKRRMLKSPIYSNHSLFQEARYWEERVAYRLECTCRNDRQYGPQLELHAIRPIGPDDESDGYDSALLYEWSRFDPDESFSVILKVLDKYVVDPSLNRLTRSILLDNEVAFKRMPAAENLHHPFSGGLVEHIRSVARMAASMADHYSRYYSELNPPLNKDLIVAGAILHDIGKIKEFEYDETGARYTPAGRLVGHIVLGRDMIRDAARQIDGFPEETLLLLEHVILAHHGKPEYDSPKRPATLEAILVHYADEIDAKMNCGVRALAGSFNDDSFTGKVFGWENSRIYRGIKPADAEPEREDV